MFELKKILNQKPDFSDSKKNELLKLFSHKDFNTLSFQFINLLKLYNETTINDFTDKKYSELAYFLETFLSIFTNESFLIPDNYLAVYINYNTIISNLVAITPLNTTDTFIINLIGNSLHLEQNKLVKILTLFSLRNEYQIDYKLLFSSGDAASTLWYWEYFGLANFVKNIYCKNIEKHIDNIELINEKANIPSYMIHFAYFHATYAHKNKDKKIKEKINFLLLENYKEIIIKNTPNNKKIAIISGFFFPEHSVYRVLYPFIESLSKDYDLTLIDLKSTEKISDTRIFNKVINLKLKDNAFDLSEINENEFSIAFYPDIGMNQESVFLSNIRIAPVQIVGYGHPVSTFGSEIDYFLTGRSIELTVKANENYSEKLLMIPGMGIKPVLPTYSAVGTEHCSVPTEDTSSLSRLIIACPWTYIKINYEQLQVLLKIQKLAKIDFKFRFLPAIPNDILYLCLKEDIEVLLGKDNVEIITPQPYEKYMKFLNEADIIIDSFHFGGYNTIIDAVYLNKPVITIRGDKAYNRFAAALLDKLGLNQLIADNYEDYTDKILKLIHDKIYREQIIKILSQIDLKNILDDKNETKYFKKAIDFLLDKHNTLIDKQKIIEI